MERQVCRTDTDLYEYLKFNSYKRLKVVVLIPNLGFGGAQRVFSEQVAMLAQYHEVIECVFNYDTHQAYSSYGKRISLQVPSGSTIISKAKYFLLRCWRLHLLKKREQPHVTISHMEGANYINILSGGSDQKVLVVHGSKSASDSNYTGFLDWIQRKIFIPHLFKLADYIVPVSDGIKYELNSLYGISVRKINVIKNSFDIQAIQLQASQPILPQIESVFSKPVIISCGRLANQKNPLALLDVFAIVHKKIPCRLVFVGDGPLRKKIIEQATTKDLKVYDHTENSECQEPIPDSDIYILGFQDNPFQFLKQANLFVMSSDFEGFPLALAEAMICGTPVISTDCPTGPRELLAPGTDVTFQTTEAEETPYGWLMPVLNNQKAINQYAGIIYNSLADKNHKKKEAVIQRMKEFDRERIEEKWLKIIDSLPV